MGKCILAGHPPAGGIGFGTYTGDNAESRTISVGVTPKWVLVYNPLIGGYYGGVFGGLATQDTSLVDTATQTNIVKISGNGFLVSAGKNPGSTSHTGAATNISGKTYTYIYGT